MIDINFDEEKHIYYDDNNRLYKSVTTLIGTYTNTFDTHFWAMYTALREKGFRVKPEPKKQIIYIASKAYTIKDLYRDTLYKAYAEAVKTKWIVLTEEACNRGNLVHNELEDNINLSKGDEGGKTNTFISPSSYLPKGSEIKTVHDLNKTILEEKYPQVYTRLKGYIERGFSIFAEKRVFLEKYGIAGMIDVPLFKGMYFAILDWKTNANELHKTAGYYKKIKIGTELVKTKEWVETGECFKYPLNHLEASKFNIYALQLSTYAYILEQWGYTLLPNGLEIIHFPLGEEPKLIKIPYLKREVEIMLNHYNENKLVA
jgi:hypothetical protein